MSDFKFRIATYNDMGFVYKSLKAMTAEEGKGCKLYKTYED